MRNIVAREASVCSGELRTHSHGIALNSWLGVPSPVTFTRPEASLAMAHFCCNVSCCPWYSLV